MQVILPVHGSVVWILYSNYTPYSGKFLLVQNFVKLCQDSSEAPHANQRNDTEWWSKEASLCNNDLLFLLCGGLRNYKSIRTAIMGEKLAFWTEGFCTADLNFNNFGASLIGSLALCIVAGWSSLQWLFRGQIEWQTVENHLVHTSTSSYQRTHIMMLPITVFFVAFIFAETGLSTKTVKICTQLKFPVIWYLH